MNYYQKNRELWVGKRVEHLEMGVKGTVTEVSFVTVNGVSKLFVKWDGGRESGVWPNEVKELEKALGR